MVGRLRPERIDMDITRRLRAHALPDPSAEREVLHAPMLKEAADEIERLREALKIASAAAEALIRSGWQKAAEAFELHRGADQKGGLIDRHKLLSDKHNTED
jgi:hypothetical protein